MSLSDRDYMRERVRRAVERERAADNPLSWPPKPWVVLTAVGVLTVLGLVYVL